MTIWLKKIGLIFLGFLLSKIVNEIFYQLLATDGISLTRAYVPAALGAIVLVYFCYLAYKIKD